MIYNDIYNAGQTLPNGRFRLRDHLNLRSNLRDLYKIFGNSQQRMIAIKFWFNDGQRSWITGRVFKAGFSSRLFRHRKVKIKMVRERNPLLLLAVICVRKF
jgi:hypothetical protein